MQPRLKVLTQSDPLPRVNEYGDTWSRVIVASNRLPFNVVREGEVINVRPSSGGLVTAMTPLLRQGIAGMWIGWPGTKEEEGLDEVLRSSSSRSFEVSPIGLTNEEIENYYEGYSNEVLSLLFSGDVAAVDPRRAMECWPAYRSVQSKFADRIRAVVRPGDIVWVHDYHLLGVGKELRNRYMRNPVGFFLHIPFPELDELLALPQYRLLVRDMLAYDIVGFQTRRFRDNFVEAVRHCQPQALLGMTLSGDVRVAYGGHTTLLGNFPVSIDVVEFERQLYLPKTQLNVRRLRSMLEKNVRPQVIFNAGRQDTQKGFVEELRAFERLLEKHPGLVGKVVLYQLMIPSRGTIPAHRAYKERAIALAKRINRRFGSGTVRQTHANMSRVRYLAYLNTADVQCVPSLADGMNLVAKESAVVGNPLTVLILGRNAGAAEELGEHALLIDPQDTDAFAETLYRALVMKEGERRKHKSALKAAVTAKDVFGWWSDRQESLFQEVWDRYR